MQSRLTSRLRADTRQPAHVRAGFFIARAARSAKKRENYTCAGWTRQGAGGWASCPIEEGTPEGRRSER